MMDAPSVTHDRWMLATQVDAALEDLLQAKRALESLQGMRRPNVDRQLDRELDSRRVELRAIRTGIEGDQGLADCWGAFSRWRNCSADLLEQCFAYVEGALTREHAIAAELCALADALLDDLSGRSQVSWSRFTVLAGREYTDRLSRVVRLRFPEASVWSLPIAAHEFGHHAARVLPQARLRTAATAGGLVSNPRDSAYLQEHVADAFATWATGPSFLASCLYLRFDARTADQDLPAHPSDLRRAHVMLRVLERLGDDGARSADALRGRWTGTLAAAGAATTRPPAELARRLDALADAFAELLAEELPPDLRYEGWARIAALRRALGDPAAPDAIPADACPWDVVHAAWECRMANGEQTTVVPGGDALYQTRDLGAAARRLCAQATASSGRGPA